MTKARHCFKSGCSYAQDRPKLDSDAAVIYHFLVDVIFRLDYVTFSLYESLSSTQLRH